MEKEAGFDEYPHENHLCQTKEIKVRMSLIELWSANIGVQLYFDNLVWY